MQRTRNVTPYTVFMKLCPFVFIHLEILSAPLHDFKTIQDLFIKLDTNAKHHTDTIQDISMKLDTNIRQYQMMCREQELQLPCTFFMELFPFVNIGMEIMFH